MSQSELLQWAILNKATAKEDAPDGPKKPLQPIDPKWVDIILGKPDSARLKECMEVIQDDSKELSEKLAAFDEFEMLVESIDNANDLRPLGLWKPLLNIMENSTEAKLRTSAAWAVATSIQNNPKAKADLMANDGLAILSRSLNAESDYEAQLKLVSCFSSLLRHNTDSLDAIKSHDIISKLFSFLLIPSPAASATEGEKAHDDHRLKNRILFLFHNILENETNEALVSHVLTIAEEKGWLGMTLECLLISGKEEVDLAEKCVTFILKLSEVRPSLVLPIVKSQLASFISDSKSIEDLDATLIQKLRNII
ncbi:hsp70 nucleotide exchange factor fes1 [Phlyctochytrium planicorne]|nr:hsp70 nucleotide exchange factor fes1 [Phlyctochytrium planicorne]